MRAGGHCQRAPLLWLLLPLIAGLTAGRVVDIAVCVPLGIAGVAVAGATICAWVRHAAVARFWAPMFAVGVGAAGLAYFHLRRDRLADWDRLPPREARLNLRVARVFASSAPGRQVNGLARVVRADRHLQDLVGQRMFFSCRLPGNAAVPQPTCEIAVIGVLECLPRSPETGGFTAYLINAGMNFQLTRARLLDVVAPPSRHQRLRCAAADRLHGILGLGLNRRPALAGIFRAMMLGRAEDLTASQKGLFMQCGALHLFAISGLHIGAMALCLQSLLLLLRLPRLPAMAVGLVALGLYVDITGASPSAVRAYLMSALVIAAFTFRRPGNALSAIATSALVVLVADPFQLFGASFQMSYGIVAVLLLLGVPLAEALQARFPLFSNLPQISWHTRHRWIAGGWRWFLGLVGIGCAATPVSALTGIQFFNLLTPASLAGNLVLIPLATLVIAAGFASLLCGLGGLTAGSVLFNHAAAVLLWLMNAFLLEASRLGGGSVPARFREAWLGSIGLALLLAVCLAGSTWQWQRTRGRFWPPFALVALLLATAVVYGGSP
jgi:competence protein ComEC